MQHHNRLTQATTQNRPVLAEHTASHPTAEAGVEVITALVAIIQHEHYALPIAEITAVYQDVVIVPVPCAPDFVAGIANLRGHVLSVVDLGVLLGLPSRNDTAGAALVVAEADDASIGFRVEAVGEIVELALSSMNPITTTMNFESGALSAGHLPRRHCLARRESYSRRSPSRGR